MKERRKKNIDISQKKIYIVDSDNEKENKKYALHYTEK